MHIGMKIKKLGDLKLWTQAHLAEVAGVSDWTIRRIEAGGNAEKATLLLILDALDTNIEELNNLFNDDNQAKTETTKKHTDIQFLHRLKNGRELVKIIANAHAYGYDYHDCNNEHLEYVQCFLSTAADVMDIWDMVEIGQRFDLENELSKQIKVLEKWGLWVFGGRQVDSKNDWITAIVEIYSKSNPLIQKIKLDKNLMPKNK